MQHPKLLERWFVFGHYIFEESTLPPYERELVILRTAWLRQSEYEWSHHVINGKTAGLTETEIIRITEESRASGWSTFASTLIQAVDQLCKDDFIGDEIWNALMKQYSTEQIMDLIFTVGQYTLLSMALNSFGVELDENTPRFPKTKDRES
ncbi:MAG: 4-carboxymuconolactone decarboxylase [Thermoproteota archaeon]|nr:4-carboxymuconolactone decarboxylase [Thermoproteota archaeon]